MDKDALFDSLECDEPIFGSALGPFEMYEEPIYEWVNACGEDKVVVREYEYGQFISETQMPKTGKIRKQVGSVWKML
jgi:hypothetical protein